MFPENSRKMNSRKRAQRKEFEEFKELQEFKNRSREALGQECVGR